MVMKEDKKQQKRRITHVVFTRENGIQVVFPNGKFLRAVQDSKFKGLNSSLDSDFHVVGIEEVQANQVGLVFVFKSGIERHFPYSQIASFTVENSEV
jgi:hypothetical protein